MTQENDLDLMWLTDSNFMLEMLPKSSSCCIDFYSLENREKFSTNQDSSMEVIQLFETQFHKVANKIKFLKITMIKRERKKHLRTNMKISFTKGGGLLVISAHCFK